MCDDEAHTVPTLPRPRGRPRAECPEPSPPELFSSRPYTRAPPQSVQWCSPCPQVFALGTSQSKGRGGKATRAELDHEGTPSAGLCAEASRQRVHSKSPGCSSAFPLLLTAALPEPYRAPQPEPGLNANPTAAVGPRHRLRIVYRELE